MHRYSKHFAAALTAAVAALIIVAPATAQQSDTSRVQRGAARGAARDSAEIRRLIEERFGPGVTQAELLERLRQSGLSRAQVRSRLQQMGYDPGLADRYFDILERGGEPPVGRATTDFVSALQRIGVDLGPEYPDSLLLDSLALDSLFRADSIEAALETGPQIFGRGIFSRPSTQFDPLLVGPVPPDYRLGPGDEIVLILTGDIEAAYTIPVNREGFFVIPDAGQIFVNGLTMDALEDRLYDRLGKVYSGVRRGPEATTHFEVSLGNLRVNQVYVIGEVERPNAYSVSAAATVFQALYLAGGPNENGSFRRVEIQRGGETVATVDLYEYLLNGYSRSGVRLEHGDLIFVPPYERRATLQGAVRRPAIYELAEGEDLRDLIRFAGGFDAEAFVRRVQVDRILPPSLRRPGIERALVDVDLELLADTAGGPIEVRDGDLIQVFAVSAERRNRVIVTGSVRRPGSYEWRPGMTLGALIDRADGLDELAYTSRAHIYRLIEEDGTRRLIRSQLVTDSTAGSSDDVGLADLDSVVVYSRAELRTPEVVRIDGFVKQPGLYPVAEGMTVRDLILAAGGFIEGADAREVEVARQPDPTERTQTTAIIYHVPVGGATAGQPIAVPLPSEDGDGMVKAAGSPRLPAWAPDSTEFELRHGDRVFVRRAPGYELPRTVALTGQVMFPGTYALERRQERLSDVIRRAGGLTAEAHAEGLRVYRDGKLMATDLVRAIREPDSRFNVVLLPGDSLHVPEYDPTVRVTGAVNFETLVLHEPGRGLDYYIERAGGYTDLADEDQVAVTYADGERAVTSSVLWLFKSSPDIRPGASIFVPAKPQDERDGTNWDAVLTRMTAVLGTLATLYLAVDRATR